MDGALTRRKLLVQGAAAGAVLVVPVRALSAPKTLPVFRLDPCNETDCDACNACGSHAENLLFPTEKHANGNRAHVACNCSIVEGTIDRGTYIALFGEPDHLIRYRADLRHPRVQAIVRNHPPIF